MLALISPAKKLDAELDPELHPESEPPLGDFTLPRLLDNSQELVDTVKDLGKGRLKALMHLSDALTDLSARSTPNKQCSCSAAAPTWGSTRTR